ncbi:MAG: hypothetical protein Tsb009_27910 [Planctomycetaceae bacterium]
MIRFWCVWLAVFGLGLLAETPAFAFDEPQKLSFNRDIRPILASKCFTCHGLDQRARKADLRLDNRAAALPVLSPGKPKKSELLARVTSRDRDIVMPPPETGKTITPAEAALLERWIREGAEYQGHWAFISPKRHRPPKNKLKNWARNPIDNFILAKLEKEGLKPSPAADKATLIRRVTLDLIGIPATIEEVETFLADKSPNAYEKVVDRLLASPRYGEHMAAAWLDAARYADTDGYQNDRYRYMSPWRDWVIMVMNENKPFDEFTIEQLAGDMLPNATFKQQVATGFCRNHRINSEDGSIPAEWHVENVVDRVDTLGTVFLGLTIGCARCHEHKYDPVTQTDYYRLFAYFNNVPEWGIGPNNGNSPPFVKVPKNWPNLSPAENRAQVPEPLKLRRARKTAGNGLKRPQPGGPETVMVMQEMSKPRPTYFLRRGQYNMADKSQVLKPGVPDSLNPEKGLAPKNRLELARWLVHPRHPLTSRVTVNRYWQHFFGTGIVKTSENFGTQGSLPTHPELLDWLATEFVRTGWDVKAIHKTIVTSATYRQSSRITRELRERDPENRLLARGPRFRLHAFVLRDQALAISGLMVDRFGGPSVKPYMPPKIWRSISNNSYVQQHGVNLYRRSIYTYWRRTIPPPNMVNFNSAEREVCTVRKEKTNTPLQALTLMNNVTFVEAARFLAERMIRDGGSTAEDRLKHGFRLATGRTPSSDELALLKKAWTAFDKRFANDPSAATALLRTGERPADVTLDKKELAAMTLAASLIMNLDETITKE